MIWRLDRVFTVTEGPKLVPFECKLNFHDPGKRAHRLSLVQEQGFHWDVLILSG